MDIEKLKNELVARVAESDTPEQILRARELRELYAEIPKLPAEQRKGFGGRINDLKQQLEQAIVERRAVLDHVELPPIDVTAPFDVNQKPIQPMAAAQGSIHPLMREIEVISDILNRMGYVTEESREIDDQYHMFESLNFPKGHPARDDYDTFMTEEADSEGEQFVAPAHTSTMQNRLLQKHRDSLDRGEAIAVVVPDRVFRNEDLDARHEHTFYQYEGVYVSRGVNVGNLVATLKEFLSEYFGIEIEARINPFYFPFTEPSFEFSLSCPFCEGKDPSCRVCSGAGWIELLGCGMVHPNVLRMAGIDPSVYTGFAWGGGIDRLVMMKYGIEDVRHFQSGKLDFLRQF